jgi:hypothetical protein
MATTVALDELVNDMIPTILALWVAITTRFKYRQFPLPRIDQFNGNTLEWK